MLVQISHIGGNTRLDRAEVMVVHLLSFGRLGSKQGTASETQIPALRIHLGVYQEVLLLRPHRGVDILSFGVTEQPQNTQCLFVQGFHRPQQGSFLIQCFTTVGAECSGNTQALFLDKGIGCGVPSGVASGLKCCPQAAGGERRGIRFTADKFLSRELHDDPSVRGRCDKAVVLLSCDTGQGLEPMRKMGRAIGHCPVLHGGCHCVGHAEIQRLAFVDGLAQGSIDLCGQIGFHYSVIEDQTSKIFWYSCHGKTPFLFT